LSLIAHIRSKNPGSSSIGFNSIGYYRRFPLIGQIIDRDGCTASAKL
jgi:hypothetical protein